MNEQLSLFGDETGIAAHQNENSSGKLIVTQLSFVEGTEMTWKDLFSGFDSLYAITYSSGLGFVTELVSLFERAEIIFGCEQVIPDFGSGIADIEWVTTAKHIGVIFQKEDYYGGRLWLFLREMREGIFRILGTWIFAPNGI